MLARILSADEHAHGHHSGRLYLKTCSTSAVRSAPCTNPRALLSCRNPVPSGWIANSRAAFGFSRSGSHVDRPRWTPQNRPVVDICPVFMWSDHSKHATPHMTCANPSPSSGLPPPFRCPNAARRAPHPPEGSTPRRRPRPAGTAPGSRVPPGRAPRKIGATPPPLHSSGAPAPPGPTARRDPLVLSLRQLLVRHAHQLAQGHAIDDAVARAALESRHSPPPASRTDVPQPPRGPCSGRCTSDTAPDTTPYRPPSRGSSPPRRRPVVAYAGCKPAPCSPRLAACCGRSRRPPDPAPAGARGWRSPGS